MRRDCGGRRWTIGRAINRQVPRLVDALPNGPRNHPTVQVFLAGGVPEVMLHLRRAGLLETEALTASGRDAGADARLVGADRSGGARCGSCCRSATGSIRIDVIMDPAAAREARADVDGVLPARAISRRTGR